VRGFIPKMNLRGEKNKDWLAGLQKDVNLASGIRLILNKDVLARYLHFRQDNPSASTKSIFQTILDELEFIWMKTNISIK
jgi:hypothetical protein